MSDTPTQAAARLLALAKDAPAGPYTLAAPDGPWVREAYVRAPSWGVVARTGLDATLPHWDGPQRAVAALFAACDPTTITMICQAIAAQAQELDALRAEVNRLQAAMAVPDDVPDQDWGSLDGAVAWHLIDRHAENWADIGRCMDLWLAARSAAAVAALQSEVEELRQRDSEAATHVEAVICERTAFTGEPPYVGWEGLGKALSDALDERDALRKELAAQKERADWDRLARKEG